MAARRPLPLTPLISRARNYSSDHEPRDEARAELALRSLPPGHKVATLTITNPSKANALTSNLVSHLTSQLRALQDEPNLRALVITGAPRPATKKPAFIGGANVSEMAQLQTSDQARAFITNLHSAFQLIRDLPVPCIARVHGVTLGAGLELMCACDLRIATQESSFGMPEVKLGIPSVIEAALLPGLIGTGRTRRMLYLGEHFDARTMERCGLVEKVVEDEDELDSAVDEWLQTICSMGPKAMRSQKRLMQEWENVSVDQGILAGVEAFAQAYEDGGQEPKEYMGKLFKK